MDEKAVYTNYYLDEIIKDTPISLNIIGVGLKDQEVILCVAINADAIIVIVLLYVTDVWHQCLKDQMQ